MVGFFLLVSFLALTSSTFFFFPFFLRHRIPSLRMMNVWLFATLSVSLYLIWSAHSTLQRTQIGVIVGPPATKAVLGLLGVVASTYLISPSSPSLSMIAAQHRISMLQSTPSPNPMLIDVAAFVPAGSRPAVLLLKVVQTNGNSPLGHNYATFTFKQASATDTQSVVWKFNNYQYYSQIPSLVMVPWSMELPQKLEVKVGDVWIDGLANGKNENMFELFTEGFLQI